MEKDFDIKNMEHFYSWQKLDKLNKLAKGFIANLPPITQIDLSIILSFIAYSAADPKSPKRDYIDFTHNMRDLYSSIARICIEDVTE